MAEISRTAAEVATNEGSTRTGNFGMLTEDLDTWFTEVGRLYNRLADALAMTVALEVFKDGDLTFGVRSGRFQAGGVMVTYVGSTAQALVDNDTNYIYLTAAGALTVNQSGFPATGRVELATIVTSGGVYVIDDITDKRDSAFYGIVGSTTDSLRSHKVPFQDLRNDDWSVMPAATAPNKFNLSSGGFGTGTLDITGEEASGNIKTDTLSFEFVMPANYVASGSVRLVVSAEEDVGAATVSTTISGEVYESDGQGGVSADLLASWDDTDIIDSWQDHTATITDAGLVAGDKLRVFLRIVTNDTGGAVGTLATIGEIDMQCDVHQEF